jgi:hypothetical protein
VAVVGEVLLVLAVMAVVEEELEVLERVKTLLCLHIQFRL